MERVLLPLPARFTRLLPLVLLGIVPQEFGGHGIDVAGLGHALVACRLEMRRNRLQLARIAFRRVALAGLRAFSRLACGRSTLETATCFLAVEVTIGSLRSDVATVALAGLLDSTTFHAGRPLRLSASIRIERVVCHTRSDETVRVETTAFETRSDFARATALFCGRLSRRLPLGNLHDPPLGVALQNSGHRRAPFSWRGDAPWVRERIRLAMTLDYES